LLCDDRRTPSTDRMTVRVGIVLTFVGVSMQQKNLLKDFCRRFGFQSAFVDDKLYLDGGSANWNPLADNFKNISSMPGRSYVETELLADKINR